MLAIDILVSVSANLIIDGTNYLSDNELEQSTADPKISIGLLSNVRGVIEPVGRTWHCAQGK